MKSKETSGRKTLFCLLAACAVLSAAPVLAAEATAETTTQTATEAAAEVTTEAVTETVTEAATEATTQSASTTKKKTVKKGLVKEGKYYYFYKKGKRVKNRWVTYKGSRYYFNAKGRAATYSKKINGKLYVFSLKGKLYRPKKAKIVTVGKNSYYVSTKGIASTGWFTVNGKLYYADSKGRLYKNKTKDGVTFSKTGAAKSSTDSQLKIVTMNIVSGITNSSMTKYQKLRACWNYVISHMSYASYYPSGGTGWQKRLALIALNNHVGNCFGYACAFAALASEVGFDPYVVSGRVTGTRDGAADGMTRHSWVLIGGACYDPEGTALGWLPGVYGSGSLPVTHTVSSITRFAG